MTTQDGSQVTNSDRSGLLPPQMLIEAGHDLDEIAGPVTIIELILEDQIPAVAAGAGRPRQAEDVFPLGDAGGCARLHGRGADLPEGDMVKGNGEAFDLLFEQRPHGFDGDVEAGETGAAR